MELCGDVVRTDVVYLCINDYCGVWCVKNVRNNQFFFHCVFILNFEETNTCVSVDWIHPCTLPLLCQVG